MKSFLHGFCTWAIFIFELDFRFEDYYFLPPSKFWESLSPSSDIGSNGPWTNRYIFRESDGNWIIDEWGVDIPF